MRRGRDLTVALLLALVGVGGEAKAQAPDTDESSATSTSPAPSAEQGRALDDHGGGRGVHRFAVVIGVNHSDRPDVAPLVYADDDAAATHRLLEEAGVRSRLFVTFDDDSKKLQRRVVADGPATERAIFAALGELRAEVDALAARGEASELFFVYSGHGDVEGGEGYVTLEDGRLTRGALFTDVLGPLATVRNHVIVDACKSYFFAFGKGPAGGKREAVARPFAPLHLAGESGLVDRTGFVLSTSSDRDSHEWERFQAGVFSHEVRSALRGAADADVDGTVSYLELSAFLSVANAGVENPRFRPDFFVRPPIADTAEGGALLAWVEGAETLLIDDTRWGHVYLESELGERIADVHPAAGEVVALRLPRERPLFLRRAQGDVEVAIAATGPAVFSELGEGPASVLPRGAVHLAFVRLFSAPFSRSDVEGHAFVAPDEAAIDAAIARVERGARPEVVEKVVVKERKVFERPQWLGPAALATAGGAAVATVLGTAALSVAGGTYYYGGELSQRDRPLANGVITAGEITMWVAFASATVLAASSVGLGAVWLYADGVDDAEGGQ